MPNLYEPQWDAERDAEPFRWKRGMLAKQAGAVAKFRQLIARAQAAASPTAAMVAELTGQARALLGR